MTKFLRRQLDANRREDGSMVLAILLIIISVALLLVIAATTISQQHKTRATRDITSASEASDSGIQSALYALNNNVPPSSASSPSTGAGLDNSTWSVSGVATPGAPTGTSWNLTSVGVAGGQTHTATATAVATALGPGQTQASKTFPDALFANTYATLAQGTIGSYYPGAGGADSGDTAGRVGTNGFLNFGSATSVDAYDLYNYTAEPDGSRCLIATIGLCTQPFSQEVQYFSADNTAQVANALAVCGGTPAAWKASVTPTLAAGPQCYSSMQFNANTTVSGTISNPTEVYVTGAISVSPGVNVNYSTPFQAAGNFIVESTGPTVAVGGAASSVATNINWLMAAPSAACTSVANASIITIYGGEICNTYVGSGTLGTSIYMDDSVSSSQVLNSGNYLWNLTNFAT